jgi:carbamate kinase
MGRRLVVALGGNMLLPHGKPGSIEDQRVITAETLRALVRALLPDDALILTHGNGPVVGNILLRNQAAAGEIPPMPLDVCDADSQGGIGYMIVQGLTNELRAAGRTDPATVVVTRVRVDPADPAFQHPTKPIGPFYSQAEAERLADEKGWFLREDSGRGWRRVVPSPLPVAIHEIAGIRILLEAGHIVIAAGGGGVPVMLDDDGNEVGVEAVIDKDRTSALLAAALKMETLVIVTEVAHVAVNFGKPDQRDLDRITISEARSLMAQGEFGEGSMKPKIEAAVTFLQSGGRDAVITSPETLTEALSGTSGTRIVPDP